MEDNLTYAKTFAVVGKEFDECIDRFLHIRLGIPYLCCLVDNYSDGIK